MKIKLNLIAKVEDFLGKEKAGSIMIKIIESFLGVRFRVVIPNSLTGDYLDLFDYNSKNYFNVISQLQGKKLLKEIIKVKKYPDEPSFFCFNFRGNFVNGMGVDLFERKKAFLKALAEFIERQAWLENEEFYLKKIKEKSFSEVKNKSVNIEKLAGFSQEQRNKFRHFLYFNENTKFGMIKVEFISPQRCYKWCPVQLFGLEYANRHVRRFSNPTGKEPMLRWAVSTGAAAGKTKEEAIFRGIMELIERDAFMINYLNKLSPPSLDLEELAKFDPGLKSVLEKFKRYDLEIKIVKLFSDFRNVNVVLAIIIDRTGKGPAISVGNCASFSIKEAIHKSISEALMIRYSTRKFLSNNSLKSIDKRDSRKKRRLYWSKIENIEKLSFFIETKEKIKISNEDYKRFYFNDDLEKGDNLSMLQNFALFSALKQRFFYKTLLDKVLQELKEKKMEVCFVDFPDEKIKELGFWVVQVLIPELQPLHTKEEIPYFGGNRIKEVPEKLGLKAQGNLNKIIHPFS